MIKLTFCLRRKEGLSHEEFHDYWLNKHGPLVRKQMKALKIRKYVQVHQLNEPALNNGIGKSRNAPPAYDGIAEGGAKAAVRAFRIETEARAKQQAHK